MSHNKTNDLFIFKFVRMYELNVISKLSLFSLRYVAATGFAFGTVLSTKPTNTPALNKLSRRVKRSWSFERNTLSTDWTFDLRYIIPFRTRICELCNFEWILPCCSGKPFWTPWNERWGRLYRLTENINTFDRPLNSEQRIKKSTYLDFKHAFKDYLYPGPSTEISNRNTVEITALRRQGE